MELNFTPPDSDAAVDWALAYAASGMSIFPCNAQKRPLTERGLKDATADEAQIRSWWARYPHGDIGWAVPAEIVVVDLDVGVGADGLKDFFECIGVNPDDVQTPQVFDFCAAAAISSLTPIAGPTRTASSSTARRSS